MNYLITNKTVNILNQYIEKVIVINLIEAIERKEKILIELDKIFDKNKIIIKEAFKHLYFGATQSHINCLKLAIKNKWKNVLIIEDDACFTNNSIDLFKKLNQTKFDVLHLGGQNALFNPFTNRLYTCYGGVAYIVNNHYYEILMRHYQEGLEKMKILTLIDMDSHCNYIFDSYWRTLQIKDNWKICYPPLFIQKKGYSYVNKEIRDFENDFYDVNFNFIGLRIYYILRKQIIIIKNFVINNRLFHLLIYLMVTIFNNKIQDKVICSFFLCSDIMIINYNLKFLSSREDLNNLKNINNLFNFKYKNEIIDKLSNIFFIYYFIYHILFNNNLKIYFSRLIFINIFFLLFYIPFQIYNVIFDQIKYNID